MFYLIKHGEIENITSNADIYKNIGSEFLPLSTTGINQMKYVCRDRRLSGANAVICSPYTRSIHSAAILSRGLDAEIYIEADVREWLPDKNNPQRSEDVIIEACNEYIKFKGVYPPGNTHIFEWEERDSVINRIVSVLKKFRHLDKVAVVCPGVVMHTLCDGIWAKPGEIAEISPEILHMIF